MLTIAISDIPQRTVLVVYCIPVEHISRPFVQGLSCHPRWAQGLQINRYPLPRVVQDRLEYHYTLRLPKFGEEIHQHSCPSSCPGTDDEYVGIRL